MPGSFSHIANNLQSIETGTFLAAPKAMSGYQRTRVVLTASPFPGCLQSRPIRRIAGSVGENRGDRY